MNEQIADLDTAQQPRLGPGERLQAARISQGISIEELAGKMRLSKSILAALQENQYDDITAPIFVKGYLRSYARLVNLDETEILEQYTTYYTDNDPPITSTSNTAADINVDDSTVKWATWLIVIILVGLLVMWWMNRSSQPQHTVSLDSSAQSVPVDRAGSTNQTETSIEVAGLDSDTAQSEQSTTSPSVQPETISGQENTSPPDIDTAIDMAVNAINSDLDRAQQNSQVDSDLATEATPSLVALEGDTLSIEVNADTWTDIRDADGKKLIYDLLRSGTQRSVSGKAPFRVFLGNGHGVALSYKGEEVDFSSRIRADNTARVVIGR